MNSFKMGWPLLIGNYASCNFRVPAGVCLQSLNLAFQEPKKDAFDLLTLVIISNYRKSSLCACQTAHFFLKFLLDAYFNLCCTFKHLLYLDR